jgi:hypothetical protein
MDFIRPGSIRHKYYRIPSDSNRKNIATYTKLSDFLKVASFYCVTLKLVVITHLK